MPVIAALVVFVFLGASLGLSVQAQADHGYHYTQVASPNADMLVRVVDENGNRSFRFSDPAQVPAGHLQWREAASVCCGGTSNQAETYDLLTGKLLYRGDFSAATRSVELDTTESGPVYIDLLLAEIESVNGDGWTSHYGYAQGTFPESVLWGTYVYGYERSFSYTTMIDPHHPEADPEVVDASVHLSSGVVFANLTRHIYDQDGYDVDRVVRSQLDPDTGIPIEREQVISIEYPDGTVRELWRTVETFQILEAGGDPLPFQGQVDTPIATGRDQTLSYGGFDMWPVEAEPHAWFDVAQAAETAWTLDDADVRAFRADAQDPHLTDARLQRSNGVVDWDLVFADAHDRTLRIDLTALKVPDGPLTVLDADVERADRGSSGHVAAETRQAALLAAPGELAAAHDVAMAQVTPRLDGYGWRIYDIGHGEAHGHVSSHWYSAALAEYLQTRTALGSGIVDSYLGAWTTVETADLL